MKTVIVIGCPRSGTLYTSCVFKAVGKSIGHEHWGKDGIVSWLNTAAIWKACSTDITNCFDSSTITKTKCVSVLHQVREPLSNIGSMLVLKDISWLYISANLSIDFSNKSLLTRSMLTWLLWNDLAEKKADFTYRIENVTNVWNNILEVIETDTIVFPSGVKKIHARRHPKVRWNDLEKEDVVLANKIKERAKKYGY